jgi:uncharacterized protein YabN with tetrapyrrole methylase and pyrophosphatase domain
MPKPPSRRLSPIRQLLSVMATLRSPEGCPWDREQTHQSLRVHAIEEVYEMVDAIETGDAPELAEELGDLLLQVVFHCQLAREKGTFDFDEVAQRIVDKLIRRHPHVFGETVVSGVDEVWANWERIKRDEKAATRHHRPSALDGIPRHLPALMRAEKLTKKARRADLAPRSLPSRTSRRGMGQRLFDLAAEAQARGWSAEALLRDEIRRRERLWRKTERRRAASGEVPAS